MSTLVRTLAPTAVGELQIITSERGVVAILWPADDRWSYDTSEGTTPIAVQTAIQLQEFFDGTRTEFTLPLDLRGTEFQQKVWRSLIEIPFGQTLSYAEQAARLGRPSAVRAVASANGKNPISIVIPCHRVIGANGALTGYAGGIEVKRLLLDLESGQQPLV
jgi:methylated-DNA-[protein]-cysteine S-methyltransferase